MKMYSVWFPQMHFHKINTKIYVELNAKMYVELNAKMYVELNTCPKHK